MRTREATHGRESLAEEEAHGVGVLLGDEHVPSLVALVLVHGYGEAEAGRVQVAGLLRQHRLVEYLRYL